MQFKFETHQERRDRLEKWRPWFAWYPVEIEDRIVWLETVLRKKRFVFFLHSLTEYEFNDYDFLNKEGRK